jgi:SAM-dependent methyltransferase
MPTIFRRAALTGAAIAIAAAGALAQSATTDRADLAWLTRVMEVRPSSVIGEIGAGGGELTLAMAKAVGASGRVFSNEIEKDRARKIAEAAEKAGLKQVTVVEGHPAQTNFPAQCCDAIFMRNVYHHFGDPAAMNASLRDSLKPGGRLAIIDFTPPPGGEAAAGHRGEDGHHGVTAAMLEAELKAAGFEIVSSTTNDRAVQVVARKPATRD